MVALLLFGIGAFAGAEVVLHVRVEGEIDRGTVFLLKRALARAEEVKGECLLISLSTSGGYLDAALECRDLLLDAPVKTVAYVNREALSAGALIAILCDGAMGAAPEKVGLGGAGDLPRGRRGPGSEPGCRRRHGDPILGSLTSWRKGSSSPSPPRAPRRGAIPTGPRRASRRCSPPRAPPMPQ
ncbi:hypothetical protein DRJ58_00410 [Candidatus Acetothermia bacterium]|nr:MAG: hypothetical protein DRJ58_00410 [Candidatus Acetothermia bacterium]